MRQRLRAKAPPCATQNSNGEWCRTVDGRSVWIPNQTQTAKVAPAPARVPAQANTAVRVYSYRATTQVFTSYPNSGPPEIINGVNWYLNGRSYFSD